MRGVGLWLNPRNGRWDRVDFHENWLKDPKNAVSLGLDEKIAQRISKIPGVDEIRVAGVEAGLVRIRDYERYISIQFSYPRESVPMVLSEVAEALKKNRVDMYAPLHISNFTTHDSVVVPGGLIELLQRMDRGETVMREGGPTDLPSDDPFVQAARKLIREDF